MRKVWRQVQAEAEIEGFVSHTLRKTVASFLDDAGVSTREISDQLGHSKVSMTQDRYLGRELTDRRDRGRARKAPRFRRPGPRKLSQNCPWILSARWARCCYLR